MNVVNSNLNKNKFNYLILLAAFFSCQIFASDNLPSSFKEYMPYILGNENNFGTLYLAPELSEQILKNNAQQKTYSSLSINSKNTSITIRFDPGMSDDPTFIIQANNAKEISYIGGDVIYMSTSGHLYSKNAANDYFERTAKYLINKNNIVEVSQPFYFVNMKCKASTALTLYTEQCEKGSKVATLQKGTTLKIVLSEYKNSECKKVSLDENYPGSQTMQFLVASPFGLVGWVSSIAGDLDREGKPLSCIRFAGD